MTTMPKGRRLTVEGWTPAERQAVDAAAKADRLSVTGWAWRKLVEAAAERGYVPEETH